MTFVIKEDIRDTENFRNFYAKECDVSDEKSVGETFEYIRNKFKTIHVLVNNAGLIRMKSIERMTILRSNSIIFL